MPEPPVSSPSPGLSRPVRVVLFANTDWYLHNFRLPLARRIRERLGAEVWVACPDGPHRAGLEAEGFRWIPARVHRRSLNPWHDLASAWRLSRELRKLQPDLLHAFTLKCILIGNLAARMGAVPRVVDAFTGLGSLYAARRVDYALAKRLLGIFFRATLSRPGVRAIFQNPEDLAEIEALAGPSVLRLIPGSGVDTRKFHPREAPPADRVVVLMVSRLTRDKGVQVFCEAARRVQAEVPGVQFWLAGDVDPGNPSSLTAEEAQQLARLNPGVHFLGQRVDVAALYQEARVAVLPARAREGLPRSLIEACASGLPLVASDLEGIREVVLPGRNGLLVAPGDPGALASALIGLLGDPSRCAAMGRASRTLALERFDEERILDATLSVYAELGLEPALDGRP